MPEIILERTGWVAIIRQLVAAGVPQHVRVHRKVEAGSLTQALDHLPEAARRKRRTPARTRTRMMMPDLAPA